MGWIRDGKSDKLAGEAAAAHQAGQVVFAALLNSPKMTFGLSGHIPDWSSMIEAVESNGWALAHWAATIDQKGAPQAYAVFRRR